MKTTTISVGPFRQLPCSGNGGLVRTQSRGFVVGPMLPLMAGRGRGHRSSMRLPRNWNGQFRVLQSPSRRLRLARPSFHRERRHRRVIQFHSPYARVFPPHLSPRVLSRRPPPHLIRDGRRVSHRQRSHRQHLRGAPSRHRHRYRRAPKFPKRQSHLGRSQSVRATRVEILLTS